MPQLCIPSIEMGARGGMVAPDEVTFEYIKGRESAPQGEAWDKFAATITDEHAKYIQLIHELDMQNA